MKKNQKKVDAPKTETVETLSIVPKSWSSALPLLRMLIERGNAAGRKEAWTELEAMAKAADAYDAAVVRSYLAGEG